MPKLIRLLLNISFAIAFAYLLSDTALLHLNAPIVLNSSAPAGIAIPKRKQHSTKKFSSYEIIAKNNLYKLPTKKLKPRPIPKKTKPRPKVVAPKKAPALPALNIKLKGTVVGDSRSSLAIIEDQQRKKDLLVSVNEKIRDATLIEIHPDRIKVRRSDGSIEEYGLKENFKTTNAPAKKTPEPRQPRRRRSRNKKVTRLTKPQATKVTKAIGNNKFMVSRSEVFGEMGNMDQIMRDIKIAPVVNSGKFSGFSIDGIKENTILSNLGVQNGDTISTVNGVAISSPQQAFSLYNDLLKARNIKIGVLRGGTAIDLDYSVKD